MNEYLDSLIEEYRAAQATVKADRDDVQRQQMALDDADRRLRDSGKAFEEARRRLLSAVGEKAAPSIVERLSGD